MAYIGEIMAMNAKHSAQNQDDSACLRRDDPMPGYSTGFETNGPG